MCRYSILIVLALSLLTSCTLPGATGTSDKQSVLDVLTGNVEVPSAHSSFKMLLLFIIGTVVLVIVYYVLKKANFVEFWSAKRKEIRMDYELKLKVSPKEAENWVKSDSDFLMEKKGEQLTVATPITFCGSLLTLTEKKKDPEQKKELGNESNKTHTSN